MGHLEDSGEFHSWYVEVAPSASDLLSVREMLLRRMGIRMFNALRGLLAPDDLCEVPDLLNAEGRRFRRAGGRWRIVN